jgi:hypothetical protein
VHPYAEARLAAERRVARPADGKDLDDFTVTDTPYAFVVEVGLLHSLPGVTRWVIWTSQHALTPGPAVIT